MVVDFEKEIGNQCMATAICRYTGTIVRCQKIANHEGYPHSFAGLQWWDLDKGFIAPKEEREELRKSLGRNARIWTPEHLKYSRPVPTIHSDIRFTIDGLWLTAGGRIVKPGGGEMCRTEEEGGNDYLLLTVEELQRGIKLEEFRRRLNNAVRRRKNWTPERSEKKK